MDECRDDAKKRLLDMVSRLRGQADGLEALARQIQELTPEAEKALWDMACGRFCA